MTRLVVDASVVGPLVIPDERDDLIPAVLEALLAGNAVVPQHWRLEVANLARIAVRKGRLREHRVASVFADLSEMIVTVDSETDRFAWTECLQLGQRHDLTAYDAAYLELALRLRLPLASRDRSLCRAAAAEGVEIVR